MQYDSIREEKHATEITPIVMLEKAIGSEYESVLALSHSNRAAKHYGRTLGPRGSGSNVRLACARQLSWSIGFARQINYVAVVAKSKLFH